jgi:lipoprotein-anchoring transpeptidase ErfK/SrfK
MTASFRNNFMLFCFGTAALLAALQLRGGISDLANATAPSVTESWEFSNPTPAATQQPRLIVDLNDRQVSLYRAGVLQRRYEIAVGKEGWETPTGQYQVIHMEVNPVWQHPFTGEVFPSGAGSPLGSRWIGFWTDGRHQIGLHGTDQEDLIGTAVSHGCIRMRDPDIQELYSQVEVGIPVIVRQ